MTLIMVLAFAEENGVNKELTNSLSRLLFTKSTDPGRSVGRFPLGVNLAWQNAKFWGNEKLEPVILEQSEQRKKESAALTRF